MGYVRPLQQQLQPTGTGQIFNSKIMQDHFSRSSSESFYTFICYMDICTWSNFQIVPNPNLQPRRLPQEAPLRAQWMWHYWGWSRKRLESLQCHRRLDHFRAPNGEWHDDATDHRYILICWCVFDFLWGSMRP